MSDEEKLSGLNKKKKDALGNLNDAKVEMKKFNI